mmetsp:Transcript_19504/g.54842  ORF Transcript_19504/g.54842 Transcript_19504/m.54842 type:complete len:200 (-) Transcript_19504:1119-1718(-)
MATPSRTPTYSTMTTLLTSLTVPTKVSASSSRTDPASSFGSVEPALLGQRFASTWNSTRVTRRSWEVVARTDSQVWLNVRWSFAKWRNSLDARNLPLSPNGVIMEVLCVVLARSWPATWQIWTHKSCCKFQLLVRPSLCALKLCACFETSLHARSNAQDGCGPVTPCPPGYDDYEGEQNTPWPRRHRREKRRVGGRPRP